VVRRVNEPTAAALAYGLDRLGQELRIAVVDFGGGTLDVTIMDFGKGVFEVKATSGNTQLGGTDMDKLVFEHLAERFRAQAGIDIRADRMAAARLKEAVEVANLELSSSTTAHITLRSSRQGPEDRFTSTFELTRADLERVVPPVIERCREPVMQGFHDANTEPSRIDRLIFVGGGEDGSHCLTASASSRPFNT
jgi:molecular chaperone DnaK